MTKVFIDGSAGTTGLRIHERLSLRRDIELITLSEQKRKDTEARCEALNNADIAFLCLPDATAIEAVGMAVNPDTRIIDTSTAHRTNTDWTYGMPELKGMRKKIRLSKKIANPGCHASGFIALVQPLIESGIIKKNAKLSCFSLTGYSGGGKKMIAEYEDESHDILLNAPRIYGLSQEHKHLNEMTIISGLDIKPVFSPIVAAYYSGMAVAVTVFADDLNASIEDIKKYYGEFYKDGLIRFTECADEDGFISGNAFSGRDDMQVTVTGNSERIVLISRFDNLGKGASGAAIQNMNILLGADETTGLEVK